MTNVRLDVKSLAATIFLGASLLVLMQAGQGSIYNAALEIGMVIAIFVCLYFSYRLILVVNDAV